MSDEMIMVLTFAIAAGAALFVAWPLMFGSVQPGDFLEMEPTDHRLGQQSAPEATTLEALKNNRSELDAPSNLPHKRARNLEPKADLDVELEIEAFRRHSQQAKSRDDTGGQ